jgi:hypothetical protein
MPVAWITGFLDFPPPSFATATRFWQDLTGYGLSEARGSASQFATLVPPAGDAYLRVQRLDGATAPRCHLDLHVDQVDLEAGRAEELGATIESTQPGLVLAVSPGGLTFCLVNASGERHPPTAARWGHHLSVVDQICVDPTPSLYEQECSFWAALTSWTVHQTDLPEYRYLARPDRMPLRILLQRLTTESSGSAHLDLACDDIASETARHVRLGASVIRRTDFWTTLADPAGLHYCITGRNPGLGPT